MQDIITRMRAKKQDEGFTLIELLVVVVIIGVLVAIAVPVYLNYRQGAADKSAQSDVRGAVSAIEQYYTDNSNSYPTAVLTGDNTDGSHGTLALSTATGAQVITLSDKTKLQYNPKSGGTYLLCATNDGGSGKFYVYNSANGGSVQASKVTTPTLAAC